MTKGRTIGNAVCVLLTLALAAPDVDGADGRRAAGECREQRYGNAQTAGDNAWMLVCSALALMMTGPGLALFYGGLVASQERAGDHDAEFHHDGSDHGALGADRLQSLLCRRGPALRGLDYLMLKGVGTEPSGYAATIPHLTFMVFQLMFAIITPRLSPAPLPSG
jgi:Amt family ammonium transporter